MRFGVLGPLEVWHDGRVVDVGSRQQRLVLISLLAAAGRSVSVDALVDVIWGDAPPRSASGTLQTYVSRLRRCLDVAGAAPRLSFDESGYRLEVDPEAVDFRQFERLADEGRAELDVGRPAEASRLLAEALALWRGAAFSELASHETFAGRAAGLEERRLAAIEDRLDADLRLGRHAAVVGDLTELVTHHPLRESLRAQLALALYRSGRQADALAALSDARRTLRDELGVDPGRALDELELAILEHDPVLDAPTTASPPRRTPTTRLAAPPDEPAPGRALVGRDAELAALLDALAEASSEARFVVIEGDPGIGKTRLADELRSAARLRGSLALWGRADESGAAPALWPWLPILRALHEHGDGADIVDELLAGEAPMMAGRGAVVRFERFEAVAQRLETVGQDAPVVVLLDDLQWADEASLELLTFLAGRLQRGVLVVATLRRLAIGRADAVTDALAALAATRGSRRLQLHGLSPADTAAMLEMAGLTSREESSERIHVRAEGNPFYALELARLLDHELSGESDVPSTVRDVIRRRLNRLPADTQELLTVGAVMGRDVDVLLLSRAASLSPDVCLERIEPAVVERTLIEDPDRPGRLRFSHALVREVLLSDLTSLRRARLHLDVADAIEAGGAGRDDAEIVAEHLWRAAPIGVGRRAAEALERAAEVALHRVAYTAAEHLLGRADQLRRATVTTDDDLRSELSAVVRLLEVMQATRYFQGADRKALARAQELAGRFELDDLVNKLHWYEWAALSTAARVREAATLAERFLERSATSADPLVRSVGHGMFGTSCWQKGRYVDAVEHLDTSSELIGELGPPGDAFEFEQRAVIGSFRLVNHALHGDWSADVVFAGFLDLIDASPLPARPSICGFAGSTAACLGRWDLLEISVGRAFAADPSSQFAFWGGQLLMQRGLLEARAGRLPDALSSFAEGEARYLSIGARTSLSNFQALMALLVAQAGDPQEAARLAGAARDGAGQERWADGIVLTAEAAVAHAHGDDLTATALLASAREVATGQGAHGIARRAVAVAEEFGLDLPAPQPA